MAQTPGFRKFEQRNITVISREDVTVDLRLEIGDLSEVITIQDSPALVQLNSSIGRNRWLLKNAPKVFDYALGGWQLTNLTRWYSGRLIQFNNSMNVTGNPPLDNPTNDRWFDTSMFSQILPTDGRRAIRTNPYYYNRLTGPSTSQSDVTLSKSFKLTERFKLEARLEAYNVFNHLVWTNPSISLTDANFDKVVNKNTVYIGREIQYGFRLSF